ncbi:MAG: sigma factor-like helix-turn-helix DNA-binding protein, partial [Acidimicrobiales bacterium]
LGDLLAADDTSVVDDVIESIATAGLEEAIGRLPELERDVVRLRFGLGGQPPASLESTARALGIGVRRVRSLEASALRALAAQPEVSAFHSAA